MRVRKWLLVLAVFSLVVAACGDDDDAVDTTTAPTTTVAPTTTEAGGLQTIKAGVLTVGSDVPFPPFEDFDASGNVIGFDADLVNELASRLGLEVEWIDTDFDTIFTQLATGRFDLVASATTITPERALQVNFTDPYYKAQQALTINTDATPNIGSYMDLGEGDSVAAQTGTTGLDWAIENLAPNGVEVREFPAAPDTYNALEGGLVTGVIFDEPSAVEEAANRPGLVVIQAIDTNEDYGFGVDPNNAELLTALNGAFADMLADGTYQSIYDAAFTAPAGSVLYVAPEITTTTVAAIAPLVIWADETRTSVLEPIAAAFTEATGVPVEIQLKGFGDIRGDSVQQAPLGEAADVFIGAHDWIGELASNGIIEPVDLGARADEFFPVALDAFSYEGSVYGLPYAVEAIGLYRNVDLVPDAPVTFEDLLAVCEGLGDTVTQCLATPSGDAFHHYPFLASTGGYIFAYDAATGYDPTDVGLDNDGAIEGFTFLDSLVKDGTLDPAVDYGTMTTLFHEGQAAFMWTGPWALPDVQAAGINYAVSPLPDINGQDAAPFVGVQGFFVNAFSEQKALAQTFVLDFVATEEVMVALYEVGLRAPAHIAAFNQVADDPDVQAFGESASAGNPMPNIPEMSSVWDNFGGAVAAIYDQSADPATALGTAAIAVREAVAG
ncbi:extracellular solute-binding protein [bacterium]|nr:extracellular solute-binding protein [bacterium]